jgi:hypothetical protein
LSTANGEDCGEQQQQPQGQGQGQQQQRIQRLKIEDTGFPILWDVVDEHDFDKELEKVRSGLLNPLSFEYKIERIKNDQTTRFETSGHIMEPLVIGEKKDDLVVNAGLIRIAQLVTGKSAQYFTYFASGTGVAIERPSDVMLSNENYRVSMVSSGFIEAVGTVMKFVGKFPSYLPSAFISEAGVFDLGTTNGGTLLFRTVYPNTSRIEHISGRTFYSLMQSINQVSIT